MCTRSIAVLLIGGVLMLGAVPAVGQNKDLCAGSALDHPPRLIGSIENLKDAVRAAGYAGPFVFQLTVEENGDVKNVQIKFPDMLKSAPEILEKVLALHFCPAVKYSRLHATAMEFRIEMESSR